MWQDVPADISEHSSGIREEPRRSRREVLGCLPDRVCIGASGSIIKNVKSVIVPNTNHLKGIPAAAAAGIVAGNAEKELEVISEVTEEETKEIAEFLEHTEITVEHINNGCVFDIIVEVFHGEDKAKVRIANYHTNIVRIEKNGEILLNVPVAGESEEGLTDRSLLDMKSIGICKYSGHRRYPGSDQTSDRI